MAEVPGSPYEPYYTAQPTERPIQLRGVDAPAGAFGAQIGSAIQTFGGDVEKASDEVFNRAMALRRMQIDGQIRDMTTQYYNEVAPIQADFLTAQGNNASQDQLNSHLARMEQVRQRYLQQAGQYGIYGQNRFGEEASSLQRSFIRESAVYSGVQTRRATIAGNNASVDILKRSMTGYESDDEFNATAAKGERTIRQSGLLDEGEDPRTIEDKVSRYKQDLRQEQVRARYIGDPNGAMALLEAHKAELGDKYPELHKEVENRWEVVEGGRLAERAAETARRTGGSTEDAVASVKAAVKADPIASKIPGMDNKVAQMVRGQIRGQNYDAQQDVNSAQQYIANKISAPGAAFKTLADLEASDPQIKTYEEQLRGTKAGALWLAGLNSWVSHNWNKAHSDQQDENFKQLFGASYNSDPMIRQQFMQDSLDLNKFDLRLPQWQQLMRRREYILNHPESENPLLNYAMRVAHTGDLGETLRQLHLDKYTDANATRYHRLTGELAISIDEWMKMHDNKRPSDEELKEQIIRPTIREQTYTGFSRFFGARRGAFEMDIPKKDMDQWKQLESERIQKLYGESIPPEQITDQQAQGAAWRSMWRTLYGQPKGTTGE